MKKWREDPGEHKCLLCEPRKRLLSKETKKRQEETTRDYLEVKDSFPSLLTGETFMFYYV